MSEWISVKDRLPEESGAYLVHFGTHASVLEYSAVHKAFNAFDDHSEFLVERTRLNPSHWMPLPEPPKEAT